MVFSIQRALHALAALASAGCDTYTFIGEVSAADWEVQPAFPATNLGTPYPSAAVIHDEEYGSYRISQTFADYEAARETGLWLRVRYRGGEPFVVQLRPELCFLECRGSFDTPNCPAALTFERNYFIPNADWSEIDWGDPACGFANGYGWASDI